MGAGLDRDRRVDRLASLALVLPLAVTGFVVAAGCWTLFAVVGVHLRTGLGLSSLQFGLLLAMPMAVSALVAVPAGLAARRFGARQVMLVCLAGLILCMVILLVTRSFHGYLLAAGGLGLAGGFYSAGLQFVSSHCEASRLGLVLGIFGAGVTGTGFSYYLVPLFDRAFSWQAVPFAYLVVLSVVFLLLSLLADARDEGGAVAPEAWQGGLLCQLRNRESWSFAGYFGAIAGSFFALALWLPDFLSAQFGLQVESGARLAQWFVIPGALAQIAGGALADHVGSPRVVVRALMLALVMLAVLTYPPMTLYIQGVDAVIQVDFALPRTLTALAVLVLGLALGAGMGGVQRQAIAGNRPAAAVVAGLMLLSACSFAFALPVLFGAINDWLGVRTAVFAVLFVVLGSCLLMFARSCRRLERIQLLHPGI